jgi:6-pyruvoyltetrahydropterin/6-carboxytetrahydropterin synthase
MFEIFREVVFSASHQLREYEGKCERLHGHNWRVRVHLEADDLDPHGMVLDFHALDAMMAAAIEPFEHQHLNDVEPFDEVNPSCENLARVICERVLERLPAGDVRVRCCDVWENDRSRARYHPRRD